MASSESAAGKQGFTLFAIDWFDPDNRTRRGLDAAYDARRACC